MKEILILFYFISIFLFIAGVSYFFIFSENRMQRRLNYYLDINKKYKTMRNKKDKSGAKSNGLKGINEVIREKMSDKKHESIEHLLKSAGVNMNPEEYTMLRWTAAVVTGGFLYFVSGFVFFLPIGGIAGYIFPNIWVKRKRQKRIESFNDALPEMIGTVVTSLRSGYSFPQAMKTVSEECESTVKEEIIILLKEMSYGISMEESLGNLNRRMPSGDLELMIQAILIQRQVGGNLAEVLEVISNTIRERNKLERQVLSLTAQGRLSGRVIAAMPFVLGTVIYFINREYMIILFTTGIGKVLISISVVSNLIGFFFINMLTKIEV